MSAFYNVDQPPFNMGSVARAIAAANNGLLFDIGDMSTLFQDAAGTIPVTAVEQPVGKILDKSGNGYHATQPVTASRPTLSARKNVLLATETLATQSVTTIAAQYTLSFTGTGSVTLSGSATGTLTGTGVDNRVSLTVKPTAGTLTLTVSGSVTKAQLELGTASGHYQRVNTATDYDTNPALFPKYLKFDGVDDYLNLPYMGLYANGSASVVMARSDFRTSNGCVYFGESNSTVDTPVYWLGNKLSGSDGFGSYIRTDLNAVILDSRSNSALFGPSTVISTLIDNGDAIKKYANGGLANTSTYSRSSSITLNNTVIGALVRTTVGGYANANMYSLIVTKSALTDAQRIRCERFLAQKAGVML